MARYSISCEVDSSDKIYLSTGLNSDYVVCEGGSLQVVEFQPTLANLTEIELLQLFGATLLIFGLAFVLRLVVDQLLNRR